MVEVTEGFLQQFVEGLKASAAAQQASASAMVNVADAVQATALELREQARAIEEVRRDGAEGRSLAVRDVVTQLKADVDIRDRNWRRLVMIAVAIIAAANVLGVPLGQLADALLKLKP